MVDFKKMADKAKDTFDKNRDKAEDLAEKGVKAYEDKTGKKAPDAVKEKVDEIDPSDNAASREPGGQTPRDPDLPATPPPASSHGS